MALTPEDKERLRQEAKELFQMAERGLTTKKTPVVDDRGKYGGRPKGTHEERTDYEKRFQNPQDN